MLEAVLDEADKKGRPEAAILAATPFSLPSSSSTPSTSKALVKKGDASPRPPLTVNTGNKGSSPNSGDGAKPNVNQLSECKLVNLFSFSYMHIYSLLSR